MNKNSKFSMHIYIHLPLLCTHKQVDQMLQILKENKKISIATHNMVAYRSETSSHA